MRIVTLEEHFTTDRFRQASHEGFPTALKPEITQRLGDLGTSRLHDMDDAGIDVQVLSFTGFGLYEMEAPLATEIAHDANEQAARVKKENPDRFNGFASLAMQEPEWSAQELERCVRFHGFCGAMIDGTINGNFLDDPRYLPVLERAVALDVPIYLHPAPPPPPVRQAYTADLKPPLNFLLSTAAWGWHVETGLHALRLMVTGLFDRLPKLKIILGHMGENLPYSIWRSNSVLAGAGLKLERSPIEVFQQNFWITTSGYFSVPPMLCAREVIGSDRILLSVDYPFSRMERAREMLKNLERDFSAEEIEGFAHGNADRLLGLKTVASVSGDRD